MEGDVRRVPAIRCDGEIVCALRRMDACAYAIPAVQRGGTSLQTTDRPRHPARCSACLPRSCELVPDSPGSWILDPGSEKLERMTGPCLHCVTVVTSHQSFTRSQLQFNLIVTWAIRNERNRACVITNFTALNGVVQRLFFLPGPSNVACKRH